MLNQDIINEAMAGEERAICIILRHYRRYIEKVCTEPIRHPDGRVEYAVNKEMEGEIISHLIMAIMNLGEDKWKKHY